MKNILTFLTLAFAVLAIGFAPAALADKAAKSSDKGDSCCSDKKACMTGVARGESHKACSQCEKTCEKTLAYFQKKGGKYAEAKNIQTLKDCISLCRTSAEFQARNSANTSKVEGLCHDICLQCAQMCKDMNDPKLADCIKSCEECADCCAKG